MDLLTEEKRSWNMSQIRGKDTVPELKLRSWLHQNGYRFRLHEKKLPGKPDIVLAKYKMVVFVHGCFWHRHPDCKYAYNPKSRIEFWNRKFESNVVRDQKNFQLLIEYDWLPIVIWECEIKKNFNSVCTFLNTTLQNRLRLREII